MYRAMILKELRETRGILLLALAFFLGVTTYEMGFDCFPWGRRDEICFPFLDDEIIAWFAWISGIFAAALGFRQSFGEAVYGTYPFLLHRPASRRWLLGMKLAVGLTAYLVCSAIPILIFGFWAATPGTHPSPFYWSMTILVWNIWLWMTLLYLGAFLSGIRPGRWLGTRLLPLAGAGFLLILFSVVEFSPSAGDHVFWRNIVIVIADALVLACIFHVARQRDF
jgi:hypothetical protein